MRFNLTQKMAVIGMLVSLFQIVIAASALIQGVFSQPMSGIKTAGFTSRAQDTNTMELLEAVQRVDDAAVKALTSISNYGQGLALREVIGSGAAFLVFVTILYLERAKRRRVNTRR
jgi:hypothetical protein